MFKTRNDIDRALLPAGWSATEVLLHESKIGKSHDYENKWGFAIFLGPKDLIRAISKLEKKRASSQRAVLTFISRNSHNEGGIQADRKSGRFSPSAF